MRHKRSISIMLCFMLLIGIAITSRCYAADPKDVFREVFARQGFDEGSFIFHVKVDTYKGQEVNTAKIRIYFGGVEKQMITLLEPERLKDRLFLVIGYNTWMHQKGLKRPIRISGQQKLFGEAGIAETAGINYLDDYGIIQVREDEEEYLYELQALDPRTAYQRVQLWIGKNDLNLKEALLLAVNGKPLKRLRYYNHRFLGGHQVATVEIEELMLKKEEKTVVEYILIEERPIPEEIFNPLMMEKSHFLIGD